MDDLKKWNQDDPLRRMVEKDSGQEAFSPMDPPDAYSPPGLEALDYEDMHPYLQGLMDEHKACTLQLDLFEAALLDMQQNGLSRKSDDALRSFFQFFDQHISSHNRKEEQVLFPLLRRRLLEYGEHSHGEDRTTGVDVLEDDHTKALQLAAVIFNFFGLAFRLPDAASRAVVMDAALEQGKSLVEMLRLHIFREDKVVFAQAQRLLSQEELEEMVRAEVS